MNMEYGISTMRKASVDFKCAGGAHEKVTASRLAMLLWKAIANLIHHFLSSTFKSNLQALHLHKHFHWLERLPPAFSLAAFM